MPEIHVLPAHLADLIAAGEVVERPGSVVKELVENSIDAGADAVSVEIQRGGMALIRVTDNGRGMSSGDAGTAFLRHATSKLRDERGLAAIGTLGFRGEALAAIASVSRVTLLTRERGAAEGHTVTLEGGNAVDSGPAGCPEGTTVIVRDLFFNTPARLKFMKKDSAEAANAAAVVTRTALSHPEISFRLLRDGEQLLHTPGDGKLSSAVYAAFGREFALGLREVGYSDENARVSGFVTEPSASRGNRAAQYFFLNGRHIKSLTLQSALEQAYKNLLMGGRFPGCVLHITIPLEAVDVNVHPAKTEVRFFNERGVFSAVHHAVKSALLANSAPPEEAEDPRPEGYAPPAGRPTPSGRENGNPAQKTIHIPTFTPRGDENAPAILGQTRAAYVMDRTLESFVEERPSAHEATQAGSGAAQPYAAEEPVPAAETPAAPPLLPEGPEFRIVGEALMTYIVVEAGDKMVLIDKHAAHEREIFDRLRENPGEIMSQQLIAGEVCQVGREEAAILLENLGMLDELGFGLDDFGGGAVILRRLPAEIDAGGAAAMLGEIAGLLMRGGRMSPADLRDGILRSVACRAAIKAGAPDEPSAMAGLVRRVLAGELKYCPHGRPLSAELTKRELDKLFKRIV